MIGRVAVVVLIAASACTHSRALVNLPAPNPNGCYVRVHDHADFEGIGDVFNGPVRWPHLEGLAHTNEKNWRNRIRSLHVGSGAVLTVYGEENFRGSLRQFSPETDLARLDVGLSGRIQSLEISCSAGGERSVSPRQFYTHRW